MALLHAGFSSVRAIATLPIAKSPHPPFPLQSGMGAITFAATAHNSLTEQAAALFLQGRGTAPRYRMLRTHWALSVCCSVKLQESRRAPCVRKHTKPKVAVTPCNCHNTIHVDTRRLLPIVALTSAKLLLCHGQHCQPWNTTNTKAQAQAQRTTTCVCQ